MCVCVCVGGKRDEDLILPVNSSLSVTLDQTEVSGEQGLDQNYIMFPCACVCVCVCVCVCS